MIKIALLLFCVSILSYAAEPSAKLNCVDHDYWLALNSDGYPGILKLESQKANTPLFPALDPRIRTMEIQADCAQTGAATVCFLDSTVCHIPGKFYGFDGKEIALENGDADVTFTALPGMVEGPNGDQSKILKVHLEFNHWYTSQKESIDHNFELWPGKYCSN